MKDALTIVVFAAVLELSILIRWLVVKHIRDERLHHLRENKAFMAQYRKEHPPSSRITAKEAPTSLPPNVVVRRRTADAGQPPHPPASAGGPAWGS